MKSMLVVLLLKLAKETVLSLLGKLPWTVLIERFLCRVIVAGLRKLAKLTTNTLDDETVEDIIKALKRPELPEVK